MKSLGIFTVIICGTLCLSIKFLDKSVSYLVEDHKIVKERIRKKIDFDQQNEAYNYWITRGNQSLIQNNYSQAYEEFLFSQKLNGKGKRANLGVTICLLNQCKTEGMNCGIAKQYCDSLLKSNKYSEKEMEYINGFR